MGFFAGLLGNLAGPWRLYLELAAAGVLAAALAGQTWRLHSAETAEATAKAQTAMVRAEWATQVAKGAEAGLKASEANRQISAELQRTKEEAEHARESDRDLALRTAAGLASERDGLRRQLAAYARGPARSGGAAVDTGAACRDRSEALGNLLGEGLRVQEDLAGDAEAANRDVRALLDAWPKVSP